MNPLTGIKVVAAGAAAFTAGWASVGALTWLRYGHQRSDLGNAGLIDAVMPDPEVDECHEIHVAAPADVTFAAATETRPSGIADQRCGRGAPDTAGAPSREGGPRTGGLRGPARRDACPWLG